MDSEQLARKLDTLLLQNKQEPLPRLPGELKNPFSEGYPNQSHSAIVRQKDPALAEELLKLVPVPAEIHLFDGGNDNPYTVGKVDTRMCQLLEQYRPYAAQKLREQAHKAYQNDFAHRAELERQKALEERKRLEKFHADGPIRASQAMHREYRMSNG